MFITFKSLYVPPGVVWCLFKSSLALNTLLYMGQVQFNADAFSKGSLSFHSFAFCQLDICSFLLFELFLYWRGNSDLPNIT